MNNLKQNFVHIALVTSVFLLSAYVLGDHYLNHDSSWYLISTLWWIEGIPIYQEILELNPPLAFYLTAPPVFFAKVAGINPVLGMKAYVYLIAAISLILGNRILSRDGRFQKNDIMVFNVVAAIGLVIIPLGTFAQREHLMVLFAWPYVVLSISQTETLTRREQVIIGLYSSLGFALKPYFLAIPLLITISRMLSERRLKIAVSAQNVTIFGFCVFYVFLSYVLHPSYFTDVIPKTILVYDAYKSSLSAVFDRAEWVTFYFILAFLTIYLCPQSPLKNASIILAAASVGALSSYLVQSKGWAYQMLPYSAFVWIFMCIVALTLYKQVKMRIAGVITAIIAVFLLPFPSTFAGAYKSPSSIQFATYFTCKNADRSYQVFSSNVYPSFPLGNRANAVPAVRSPALWLFPGIVHRLAENPQQPERAYLQDVLKEYTGTIIDDLERSNPDVMFFDDREYKSYFQGAQFDYIAHFRSYPRFEALWKKYNFVEKAYKYKVYRRKECD